MKDACASKQVLSKFYFMYIYILFSKGSTFVQNVFNFALLSHTKQNIIFNFSGNKCDLESLREVEVSEVAAVCECIPEIIFSMEVSAKENTNVDEAFLLLATELKVILFHVTFNRVFRHNLSKESKSHFCDFKCDCLLQIYWCKLYPRFEILCFFMMFY